MITGPTRVASTLVVVAFVVLALVGVFVIAAVVVGREARRLASQPPQPVLDLNKAVEWVAQHLPYEISAELSYEDVRKILDWHLEFLRFKGVSSNGSSPYPEGPIMVGGAETAEYILTRVRATNNSYTPAQVHAVLETQMAYLQAIGALGPVEPPESEPKDRPPAG